MSHFVVFFLGVGVAHALAQLNLVARLNCCQVDSREIRY